MYLIPLEVEGGGVGGQKGRHIGKTAMAAVDRGEGHKLALTSRRRRLEDAAAHDVH